MADIESRWRVEGLKGPLAALLARVHRERAGRPVDEVRRAIYDSAKASGMTIPEPVIARHAEAIAAGRSPFEDAA
jgi:hypothetical protein